MKKLMKKIQYSHKKLKSKLALNYFIFKIILFYIIVTFKIVFKEIDSWRANAILISSSVKIELDIEKRIASCIGRIYLFVNWFETPLFSLKVKIPVFPKHLA